MLRIATRLAVASLATAALVGVAAAQQQVRSGTLTCDIGPGVGLIITSTKPLNCVFQPANGPTEAYVGTVRKFGIDIGATTAGRLVWAVYAPTTRGAWALAGSYAGASAEASVGAGVGANALVGGSNRTISLQPLSVQGQAGLNLAAGVADFELRPAR